MSPTTYSNMGCGAARRGPGCDKIRRWGQGRLPGKEGNYESGRGPEYITAKQGMRGGQVPRDGSRQARVRVAGRPLPDRSYMQHQKVWSRPEAVVRHWLEIFSHAYPTHGSRRLPGSLDGQCLTGALRRVAPGMLTLVDYLLGTLHAWIREGASVATLGHWWERYRMQGGQVCVGMRLRAIDAALYWRYPRTEYAFVMAPPIGRDRWRCPAWLGRMVRVIFRQEALPPPTRCRERPLIPPARWREAPY